MKKTIVIFEHNAGGRLCNQLWNFISIYAYCLEKGYKCRNYSFFEEKKHNFHECSLANYYDFFNISSLNILIKLLLFFHLLKNKFFRKLRLYAKYVKLIKIFYPKQIIYSGNLKPFYLLPSKNQDKKQLQQLKMIERSKYKKIYLNGWLFRNPIGIKKFRTDIKEYFKPKNNIIKTVNNFISPLRNQFKHIVGVHIRQTDYKTYEKGRYLIQQEEVKEILEDYLKFFNKENNEVLFIICSDGPINELIFAGLNIKSGLGKMMEDLFTLSSTDIIIGSNSTYGAFAAYYGNIPIAVFKKPTIDWIKINIKDGYNYNNDCTLTHQ